MVEDVCIASESIQAGFFKQAFISDAKMVKLLFLFEG